MIFNRVEMKLCSTDDLVNCRLMVYICISSLSSVFLDIFKPNLYTSYILTLFLSNLKTIIFQEEFCPMKMIKLKMFMLMDFKNSFFQQIQNNLYIIYLKNLKLDIATWHGCCYDFLMVDVKNVVLHFQQSAVVRLSKLRTFRNIVKEIKASDVSYIFTIYRILFLLISWFDYFINFMNLIS